MPCPATILGDALTIYSSLGIAGFQTASTNCTHLAGVCGAF